MFVQIQHNVYAQAAPLLYSAFTFKMEQHTVPPLSQMDSEPLCRINYGDITKEQMEYIISESGGLPGIITICGKVSEFKRALYVHNSREWKKFLIQLKSESITVHKHVRLFLQ